jgi:hypothetical protein
MTVDHHIIDAANDQSSEFEPSFDVEAWDHGLVVEQWPSREGGEVHDIRSRRQVG